MPDRCVFAVFGLGNVQFERWERFERAFSGSESAFWLQNSNLSGRMESPPPSNIIKLFPYLPIISTPKLWLYIGEGGLLL